MRAMKFTRLGAIVSAVLLGALIACGDDVATLAPTPITDTAPTITPSPIAKETVPPVITPEPTSITASPTAAPEPTPQPALPTPAPEPTPTPDAVQGDLFLQLVDPAESEVVVSESSLNVAGRTRVDAVVTVNDTLVEPDIEGGFFLSVELEEGPNVIEIVASVASGEQLDLVLVVLYIP